MQEKNINNVCPLDRYIDKSVKPDNDFYKYATGLWINENPQPLEYPSWDNFDKLEEDNYERMKEIVNSLDASDTMQKKMLDYWYVFTNYDKRNSEGNFPMLKYISKLESLESKDEMLEYVINELSSGLGVFVSIGPDEKDSLNNVVYIGQDLSLGNKEYYLSLDMDIANIRNKYIETSVKILREYGFTEAKAKDTIEIFMEFETQLAKYAYSEEELVDAEKNYHKYTVAQLSEECHFDIDKFLQWHNLTKTTELVVSQPEPVIEFFRLLSEMTEDELRICLIWTIISDYSGCLTEKYGDIAFEFTQFITGQKERTPKWKRELNHIEEMFPEEIGKIYAMRYFGQQGKERMYSIMENIRSSFSDIISSQVWMSEDTKKIALDKLNSMTFKIGYPEKWHDYSDIPVNPENNYLDNRVAISKYSWDVIIRERYNKPVDLEEWPMLPQDINACYMTLRNEFCFPCGILQPPFYSNDYDDALIYGAIGVIIGHEMTHGFDNNGRKYTKDGNMSDWWKTEDSEKFEALTEDVITRFNNLPVLENLNANGKLTLNENIADFGGVSVAYNALKKLVESGKARSTYDTEFTWQQLFFISYAQVWAGAETNEMLRARTLNGTHSAMFNRVKGTLPMIDAWYDAFGITEDSPMYVSPDKRCKIWKLIQN